MTPMVSIVLPTFNRANLITRSLNSLMRQSFTDFEIVVVDDASTDDTKTILSQVGDPRVRVVSLERNLGPSGARNRGIAEARGEFIAFQDSDDEWYPEKLQQQVALLKGTTREVAACYSRYELIRDKDSIVVPSGDPPDLNGDIYTTLLHDNVVGAPTLLVRREILMEVGGFDDTLQSLEDWDLALRIARKYKYVFLDRVLVSANWTQGGVNQKSDEQTISRILLKHLDAYLGNNRLLGARKFWELGHALLTQGQMEIGRQLIGTSLELHPTFIRRLELWVSYLGPKLYGSAFKLHSLGREK